MNNNGEKELNNVEELDNININLTFSDDYDDDIMNKRLCHTISKINFQNSQLLQKPRVSIEMDEYYRFE